MRPICQIPGGVRRTGCGQPAAGPRRARVINLKKAIETSLASDYPKLDALYKELHAHPELAFQEVKTAAGSRPKCARWGSRSPKT